MGVNVIFNKKSVTKIRKKGKNVVNLVVVKKILLTRFNRRDIN